MGQSPKAWISVTWQSHRCLELSKATVRKVGLQSWLRRVCVSSPRVLLAQVFNTWYRCHPQKVSLNPVCQMWLYVACHTSLNRFLHFAFCRNMSASFQSYRQIAQPWSGHRHCLHPTDSYSGLSSEPHWRPLCPKDKCQSLWSQLPAYSLHAVTCQFLWYIISFLFSQASSK